MDEKRRQISGVVETTVRALGLAGGIALLLLALLTVFIVVMRYLVKMPQAWAFDISLFLQVGLIFFGGAYTMLEDGHVSVDLILLYFPERARLVTNTVTTAMVFIFSAILTWKGIEQAIAKWGQFTDSAARLPLFPSYAVIPLGAFFLCLICISKIGNYLHLIKRSKKRD
ncbi:MAG: TRAP transporter small permease [Pseudomonadota bacterium]